MKKVSLLTAIAVFGVCILACNNNTPEPVEADTVEPVATVEEAVEQTADVVAEETVDAQAPAENATASKPVKKKAAKEEVSKDGMAHGNATSATNSNSEKVNASTRIPAPTKTTGNVNDAQNTEKVNASAVKIK